jgi:diacylglycerol kinase (ATP)
MSATKAPEGPEAPAPRDAPAQAPRDAPAPPPQQPPARPAPRVLDDPGSRRGTTSLIQSFNYAFEGLIWTLRSQRNMRIHFAVATIVLVLAVAYDVSKIELIALLLAIAFVLIAEMVNTAIEAATDIATSSFNPLAKLAKDIAAGAVLIASVIAVVIGYLVLADRVGDPTDRAFERVYNAPIHLTVIALFVAITLVIALKAITGRGTPLRGGLPSGHAALAFAGWAAITLLTDDFDHRVLVSTVAFIMACLVAQTRVESGIHSTLEVALGGLVGSLSTLVLFQAFG